MLTTRMSRIVCCRCVLLIVYDMKQREAESTCREQECQELSAADVNCIHVYVVKQRKAEGKC